MRSPVLLKINCQHPADILRVLYAEDLELILYRTRQLIKRRIKIIFLLVPAGTAKR